MLAFRGHLFYNISITNNHSPIIMNLSTEYIEPVNRIKQRILSNDNFENVAYVCCDWEEFVFEVAEWGVDHIAQVDFDSLTPDEVLRLDEFIASFGCSPSQPHPCSKYADPQFA